MVEFEWGPVMLQERSGGGEQETEGAVMVRGAALYDAAVALVTFGRARELYRHTAAAAAPRERDRVIDIGCGTGLLTCEVAKLIREGEIVGIDASEPMIDVARRKRSTPICRYEAALAEDLPFEDEYFDVAVSSLFFHHLGPDLKEKCAAEMARVLRRGGRVAVADFDKAWNLFGRIYEHVGLLAEEQDLKDSMAGVLPEVLRGAGLANVAPGYGILGCIRIYTARKPSDEFPWR